MEDTFKVRVDRAFGSLDISSSSSASTKSTPASLSSLWCLTDEEIQRNEWIKDKITAHKDKDKDEELHRLKNPKPYSPFLEGLLTNPQQPISEPLESDIQEIDDDDDDGDDDDDDDDEDENKQPQLSKPDDHNNEEWDIRSSVGMDCTLDNEEEEDADDKVALAKEESVERFYMKEVNDYEVDIDSNNELPDSLTDVIKDTRANHMAAKLRLKEDDESAKKSGLQVSDNNIQESIPKSNQVTTKSKKKVSFEQKENEVVPFWPRDSSSVPDYIKNPSKYTHYTFDSLDDVDEETNKKACMDLFSLLKGSNDMETQDNVPFDPSTPIVFTPKKKSNDVLMKKIEVYGYEEHTQKKVVPVSIADVDIEDNEVCAMDEDEPEIATNKSSGLQKSGRKYRTKVSADVE